MKLLEPFHNNIEEIETESIGDGRAGPSAKCASTINFQISIGSNLRENSSIARAKS